MDLCERALKRRRDEVDGLEKLLVLMREMPEDRVNSGWFSLLSDEIVLMILAIDLGVARLSLTCRRFNKISPVKCYIETIVKRYMEKHQIKFPRYVDCMLHIYSLHKVELRHIIRAHKSYNERLVRIQIVKSNLTYHMGSVRDSIHFNTINGELVGVEKSEQGNIFVVAKYGSDCDEYHSPLRY